MPGTITTDQVVIKAAEVTGDYLVLGTFATAQALNDDIKVEGTNAINGRVSANTAWSLAATAAAVDMTVTDRHIWMWIKTLTWPSQDTKANGGIGISISSDTTPTLTGVSPSNGPTNSKTWYLDGSNTQNTAGWICYCVDPNGTADLTLGTPVLTSIDRVGLRAKVTGTVTNKTLNIQHDVIRYGTGLTIVDGTAGSPAGFVDVYSTDSSNTNAWGVLTQEAGIYYGAGRFNIGTTGQTAVTFFKDTSKTLVFRDFPVSNTLYGFVTNGTGSFLTTLQFGNISGSVTSDGCNITAAGSRVWNITVNANSKLLAYGSSFTKLNAATLGSTSEIKNCTITSSGTIDVAGATISGCSFNSHTTTQLKVDSTSEMANITSCTFTSSGTTHAIELTAAGTYTFSNLLFTNYGADGTVNAAVYNNSGGAVTINVTGTAGNSPTYRNGVGASTTVNNAKALTITNIYPDSEIRLYRASDMTELQGSESVTGGITAINAVISGGTGYTVNDVLTLSGGTFTVAGQVKVTAVNSGVITAVSIQTVGTYTVPPTAPISVTGGTGSGATFNLSFGGSFQYSYNYTTDTPLITVVFHRSFKDVRLTTISLLSTDQTIPVSQTGDRVYTNP